MMEWGNFIRGSLFFALIAFIRFAFYGIQYVIKSKEDNKKNEWKTYNSFCVFYAILTVVVIFVLLNQLDRMKFIGIYFVFMLIAIIINAITFAGCIMLLLKRLYVGIIFTMIGSVISITLSFASGVFNNVNGYGTFLW